MVRGALAARVVVARGEAGAVVAKAEVESVAVATAAAGMAVGD